MESFNSTEVLNGTQDENGLVTDEKDLPPLVLVKKVIFTEIFSVSSGSISSLDFLKSLTIYLAVSNKVNQVA